MIQLYAKLGVRTVSQAGETEDETRWRRGGVEQRSRQWPLALLSAYHAALVFSPPLPPPPPGPRRTSRSDLVPLFLVSCPFSRQSRSPPHPSLVSPRLPDPLTSLFQLIYSSSRSSTLPCSHTPLPSPSTHPTRSARPVDSCTHPAHPPPSAANHPPPQQSNP